MLVHLKLYACYVRRCHHDALFLLTFPPPLFSSFFLWVCFPSVPACHVTEKLSPLHLTLTLVVNCSVLFCLVFTFFSEIYLYIRAVIGHYHGLHTKDPDSIQHTKQDLALNSIFNADKTSHHQYQYESSPILWL